MPTSANTTFSATRLDPIFDAQRAKQISVQLKASTTYHAGHLLAEVDAAPGTYAPYDRTASDGTQLPKGFLEYACTTDSAGLITWVGEFGMTAKSAPLYVAGTFDIAKLYSEGTAGITTAAIEKLNGLAIQGQVSSSALTAGILRF